MKHNREATAYHEAGHAVVAWVQGYKPHNATIIPDEDSHGHVLHADPLRRIRLEWDNSDGARLRAEKAIRILLAGMTAQRKVSARSVRRWHAHGDYREAVEIAAAVSLSIEIKETNAFLRWLQVQTEQIVE